MLDRREMKYFEIDDNEAWQYLKERGYEHYRGIIYEDSKKRKGKVMTKKEKQAIEYLISEWDWQWDCAYSCPV